MQIMVMCQRFIVIHHSNDVVKNSSDYNQLACFYSKAFSDIRGLDNSSVDCYVKITNAYGTKTIYRKAIAKTGVRCRGVSISHRSSLELGVSQGDDVYISRSSWLSYNLHNSDRSLKGAFIFAFIGFICAIFSSLKDIYELIFK
jgi:hypothetical protein